VDEYRFAGEPEEEEYSPMWSTAEEERTFRLVRDLLMEMHDRGSGIYIMPVREGMRAGGFGSEKAYGVDGWVVGELTANGGDDLAVGPWLDQVVEAARAASQG
jgi:hypothetical protein